MNGPKVDWFRGVDSNGAEPPPLPKFEDGADLCDADIPIPSEIVAGVLHQGSKLALGGSSKSYKTYLLIDLAVGVALGLGWLGFKTAPTRVLYINLEIQRCFFRRRLKHICRKHGVTLKPGMLDIWNLRGHEISIEAIWQKLSAWVRLGDYGLIIIDPIYKTFGEENETAAIKHVLTYVERIADALAVAVAWAAHFSKGNQADKEAIDRISGSGIWGRDPDSILTFTRHEEDDCFIVQMTLRDFPAQSDFTVRFEDGMVVRDSHLDPTKFRRPKRGRPLNFKPEDLAKVLGDDELSTTAFCKRAMDEIGISRAQFFVTKKLAEELNLISANVISKKWERTQVQK